MMQHPTLSPEELKKLVREAVREELNEELNAAGLRLDGPDHQDEARDDFKFLHRMRLAFNGAAAKIGGAVILAIVSGFIWLVWTGFQVFTGGRNG